MHKWNLCFIKFCFLSRSQLYLYFSGKQDQKIEITRAMTNEKKRIKKDSYLIWLGFFSLWFVNVLADVGAPKSVKIRRSDYFFCFFVYLFFVWFFVGNFFCCHLCLLVHWPQRYYCKFTRRAQSGLRPELELHLKALASSIAKPKRNALHSAVLLHGTMAGFVQYCQKTKYLLFWNILVYTVFPHIRPAGIIFLFYFLWKDTVHTLSVSSVVES